MTDTADIPQGNATPTASDAGPPVVRVKARHDKRLRRGRPWAFSNEIEMTAEAKALAPGTVVRLEPEAGGEAFGLAFFNPHSLIAARLLTRDPAAEIDVAWLAGRLESALALRQRLIDGTHYRLVHAEADGLPGLVVDRFGETLVVQPNTAGMDRLWPKLGAALDAVLSPRTVVIHGDTAARRLEGLEPETRLAKGRLEGPLEIEENEIRYLVDPLHGQKTGWFYDQRDNRAFMARLAGSQRVLDLFAYTGGFALACARAGARSVLAVESAEPALALAARAAALNGLAERCEWRRAQAFATLETLAAENTLFDIVIADPPAFARTRRDVGSARKGYRKLARLAAAVTAPGGLLFLASCSHHVTAETFREECARGLHQAGRNGRILREAGAAPDHPVHPFLPETAYLKALVFALD